MGNQKIIFLPNLWPIPFCHPLSSFFFIYVYIKGKIKLNYSGRAKYILEQISFCVTTKKPLRANQLTSTAKHQHTHFFFRNHNYNTKQTKCVPARFFGRTVDRCQCRQTNARSSVIASLYESPAVVKQQQQQEQDNDDEAFSRVGHIPRIGQRGMAMVNLELDGGRKHLAAGFSQLRSYLMTVIALRSWSGFLSGLLLEIAIAKTITITEDSLPRKWGSSCFEKTVEFAFQCWTNRKKSYSTLLPLIIKFVAKISILANSCT